MHVTPGTRASALRGAPPSSFGPNGGQLFSVCHDSASVNQQMLLSQQLAPQQQLRLDLLTWAPFALATNTSPPQALRTFSSVFLWILSHQWSQKGFGVDPSAPHHPLPVSRLRASGSFITDQNWEICSNLTFSWENSTYRHSFLIPKLSTTSTGALTRSCWG